jgi:pyruvate dehydrogenase E1 component alpha subunit
MVQVREFDRRMLMLQRQGRIGFYGPILGQEAATVGSVAAIEKRDWMFPALREGAAAMMRGLSLTEAINQLIGNGADRCKGRQMPCHYTLQGRQLLRHVVGDRHADQPRGRRGDGGAPPRRRRRDARLPRRRRDLGNDFHCGMNFAAVYQSPCVLFCQNNQWAISVPISKQSASETLAQKGKAYGMPYVRVDGNDVLAVYSVTKAAVERARSRRRPDVHRSRDLPPPRPLVERRPDASTATKPR